MDTGFVLVSKDTLARMKDILGERVLLPLSGMRCAPGGTRQLVSLGHTAGKTNWRQAGKHLGVVRDDAGGAIGLNN